MEGMTRIVPMSNSMRRTVLVSLVSNIRGTKCAIYSIETVQIRLVQWGPKLRHASRPACTIFFKVS